jgi:hypothetical protein
VVVSEKIKRSFSRFAQEGDIIFFVKNVGALNKNKKIN